MNVQQWREMSGLIDRLVAVGAVEIEIEAKLDRFTGCDYEHVVARFPRAESSGAWPCHVVLAVWNPNAMDPPNGVDLGDDDWGFDTPAEAVEWVEACHVAACFALLDAAGFERGPWGEWHKDGCLIQPHTRYGELRFDIHTPRRPSDWGPLAPPDMRRGDQSLYRTFTNLDMQTLLEFRGWPTAEQVEADEEADRLAALLSPETLDRIDAVLAEVDAGILPDDGVDADVSLQKVRRAAEG